jgi:hypothetical protein
MAAGLPQFGVVTSGPTAQAVSFPGPTGMEWSAPAIGLVAFYAYAPGQAAVVNHVLESHGTAAKDGGWFAHPLREFHMTNDFLDRRTAVLSLAAAAGTGVVVPSELKGQMVMVNNEQNIPEPIRGDRGASILGPRNIPLERQNPDLLASPYTDNGTIPNTGAGG